VIGSSLTHYRITAALGAGGMGEVWRAEDTKLGREVALKVLPEEFAEDPERMARFEREAKVLASLNHPNIAHLNGLESEVPQTVIPSEAAGRVEGSMGIDSTGDDSPHPDPLLAALTQDDNREMLTGSKLFDGETVSDVRAAVLTREPDLRELPPDTPVRVRRVLGRCLQRDPRRRIRDMGDVRLELEEDFESGDPSPVPPEVAPEDRSRRARLPWMLAATMTLAALALGLLLVRAPGSAVGVPTHLALTLPEGLSFAMREKRPVVAISPAGDELVFNASDGRIARLYHRSLNSLNAVPLEGTEGARAPFYSPDGRWIGFTSGDKRLKKLSLDGGQAVALADGDWGGGSWGADGSIIYTPNYLDGLWRVSAEGGATEELTQPDPTAGELNHSWPDHIPGTDAVVFTSFRLPLSESRVELYETATRERRLLVEDAVFGRYVAYESDESGRGEIDIQSFPGSSVRMQATRDGGGAPVWAADSELFYWQGNLLFVVPVATTPELTIGEPEALFTASRYTSNTSREYDVSGDGQRVLMAKIPEASEPREVQIVLNWFTELERLAGRGGAR